MKTMHEHDNVERTLHNGGIRDLDVKNILNFRNFSCNANGCFVYRCTLHTSHSETRRTFIFTGSDRFDMNNVNKIFAQML